MTQDIKDRPMYKLLTKQDANTRLQTMKDFKQGVERFINMTDNEGSVNICELLSYMEHEIQGFEKVNKFFS